MRKTKANGPFRLKMISILFLKWNSVKKMKINLLNATVLTQELGSNGVVSFTTGKLKTIMF